MTPTEAVDFVELIVAAWPHTRTEEKTADIWYDAGLNDVSWGDGGLAIKQLLRDKSFISLAEILAEVRRIRELRIARRPIEDPPAELTDDHRAYQARILEDTKRLGDGYDIGKALETGKGHAPTADYDQARGPYRDPLRIAALKVRCPWSNCGAAIGTGCHTKSGTLIEGHGHDHRLVAAGLADWVEVEGVQRAVLRGREDLAS